MYNHDIITLDKLCAYLMGCNLNVKWSPFFIIERIDQYSAHACVIWGHLYKRQLAYVLLSSTRITSIPIGQIYIYQISRDHLFLDHGWVDIFNKKPSNIWEYWTAESKLPRKHHYHPRAHKDIMRPQLQRKYRKPSATTSLWCISHLKANDVGLWYYFFLTQTSCWINTLVADDLRRRNARVTSL